MIKVSAYQTLSTQSTWYLQVNGVVKSVGIIKFPARPILAAPDEHYCEECAAGDEIRRTNALVLSAPRSGRMRGVGTCESPHAFASFLAEKKMPLGIM